MSMQNFSKIGRQEDLKEDGTLDVKLPDPYYCPIFPIILAIHPDIACETAATG